MECVNKRVIYVSIGSQPKNSKVFVFKYYNVE